MSPCSAAAMTRIPPASATSPMSDLTGGEAPTACRRRASGGDGRPGRPPQPSRADLVGRSVLGRFNPLIVDFVSLFVRFISLFGRVGNLHSTSRNINDLPAQVRSLGGP